MLITLNELLVVKNDQRANTIKVRGNRRDNEIYIFRNGEKSTWG